jgi:hypothetical protein
LSRCVKHMQNVNESFHSLVRRMAPKESFNGTDVVKIAINIIIMIFNDGSFRFAHIIVDINKKFRPHLVVMCETQDKKCLFKALTKSLKSAKEARAEKNHFYDYK